jgi:integrase
MMNKPITQVSKLLGHKDPSITLTGYSHWFEGVSSESAMVDLAAAVFDAGG